MNLDEQIRLNFPYHLAKVYEMTRLEQDPRVRVQHLVAFFEEVLRYLALIRLATYLDLGLEAPAVERARAGLERPSMGHWLDLMSALGDALIAHDQSMAMPPLQRKHTNDAYSRATMLLKQAAGNPVPGTVRLLHFMQGVVEFRNKKIGHGSLTAGESRDVLEPLADALEAWVAEVPVLFDRHLVHIERVEYQRAGYLYTGTNLNAGNSLDAFHIQSDSPLDPEQVYLHIAAGAGADTEGSGDRFVPLSPWMAYDSETKRVFAYDRCDADGKATLRCPYEHAETLSVAIDMTDLARRTSGGAAVTEHVQVERHDRTKSRRGEQEPEREKKRGSTGMGSWYSIIEPHRDIREGDFSEDIFAADIGDVYAGVAPDDYQDPYLFYRKTFITAGLEALLRRVHRKLTEGKGPSVIQIQTPFGGGKTHSLVAIYHYLENGEKVRELLPNGLDLLDCKSCIISGDHWNPVQGYPEHPGQGETRRLTFWGELAYRIGGPEGYEVFRENDERRIAPGKSKLRAFLEPYQPFVLLFDEILEYINRAHDMRDAVEQSLGTQTFSFFQELTETVASLPRGLMVVTLPSSHLEDFGDREEESLARLGKVFGRVETIETPVQGEEIYAVVRRRLFDVETLKRTQMRETVHRYFQQYQQNRDDVPPKARGVEFRDRMEQAYPFHPDVIDILYEKWSTFSTFQRTRGVLRLLANVVEDLYHREANIDMILPGDINMQVSGIREEFLKHIGREYEGVIGSDIAGHEAKAQALDAANRQWAHLAERTSTAIFFHSFSADDSEKGVSLPYIKLATMRSDTIPAMVTDVLQRLSTTLWYMNSRGETYYFSRIPNLNRMILDKKELFSQKYEECLKGWIAGEVGQKIPSHVWPEDIDAIGDNRTPKLILLRPDDDGASIPNWIERKGASFREFQNTLLFALADSSAFVRLREDAKTFLALEEIEQEVAEGTSPLPEEKLQEVRNRKQGIARDMSDKVRRMYHVLRSGERTIDLGQPVTGAESLTHWYWRELTSADSGRIVTQLHYRLIVNKFLAGREQVSSAAVRDQFYKNTALPLPSEPSVVARAIQLGVQEGAMGLTDIIDGEMVRYSLKFGEDIALGDVTFAAEEMLISRAQCEKLLAQWADEDGSEAVSGDGETTSGEEIDVEPPTDAGLDLQDGGDVIGPVTPTEPRYKRVHLTISGVAANKIADVNRGIFIPLSNLADDGLTFTLELEVASSEGIPESVLETKVRETIRQIGAVLKEEEKE